MDYYLLVLQNRPLVSKSCKSVAVIAGCSPDAVASAGEYGRHLGLAFQLIDDVLDFTGSSEEMGKAALADVRAGLATAPVLFAAEEHPELLPLIQRRFKEEGDVETAIELVHRSRGIRRAKEMAEWHGRRAVMALRSIACSRKKGSGRGEGGVGGCDGSGTEQAEMKGWE